MIDYRGKQFTQTDFLVTGMLFRAMAWVLLFSLLGLPTEIPIVAYVIFTNLKEKINPVNIVKSRGFALAVIAFFSLLYNYEREFIRNIFDYAQFVIGICTAYIFVSLIRKRILLSNALQRFKAGNEMMTLRRSLIRFGSGLLLTSGACIILTNVGATPEGGSYLKSGLAEAKLIFPFALSILLYLLPMCRDRALLCIFALPILLLGNSKTLLFTTLVLCIVSLSHKPSVKKLISLNTIASSAIKFSAIIIVIFLLLFAFNPDRLKDIITPQDSLSTMSRLSLIRTALDAGFDNPLLGTGPAGINISINYDRYHKYDGLESFIEAGILEGHLPVFENGFTSGAHNGYADLLASYGFIFIFLFISWLAQGGVTAFQSGILPLKILFILVVLVYSEWQYSQLSYGLAMIFIFLSLKRLPIRVVTTK